MWSQLYFQHNAFTFPETQTTAPHSARPDLKPECSWEAQTPQTGSGPVIRGPTATLSEITLVSNQSVDIERGSTHAT